VKISELSEICLSRSNKKSIKTAEAVCFGAKALTSIIHSFCWMNKKVVSYSIKFLWSNVLPDVGKVRIFFGLV